MLSTSDLERLIAVKKREIEAEKTLLGLASEITDSNTTIDKDKTRKVNKQVQFSKTEILRERDDSSPACTKDTEPEANRDLEEIPADLERYIRRYLGLPVMLKAGEYSPNNPLIRGERPTGDVLLGLGEYERRRNTLRKIRQRQYREYLDQQAKIKQEAKEKAERERREREERERLQEERQRERERELERDRYSPERRRASVSYTQVCGANNAYNTKVDTGVQVNNISKPLSVAVQTDEDDLFRLSPSPKNLLTQAERELSPRTVVDSKEDRPIHPASWTIKEQWDETKHWKETKDWQDSGTDWKDPENWKDDKWKVPETSGKEKDWNELRRELESGDWNRSWKEGDLKELRQERRRSYGDFDERIKRATSREKASSETRKYKPSVFDADAIELRNLQVEKEAAARRQFYQQELKNQILEQQRIREERKNREKMLEQAEMRRLEQQLRSLRAAQDMEIDRQHLLDCKIRDDRTDYDSKRTTLQKEIDLEHQSLLHASTQANKRIAQTSKSETFPSKLPFYYPKTQEKVVKTQENTDRLPYSMNIATNSVFAPNYDVESYLRRNLNPSKESLNLNRLDKEKLISDNRNNAYYLQSDDNRNIVVEKALVHDRPKIDENRARVDESHPKFDENHPKRYETHPKSYENYHKQDETHPKRYEYHPKHDEVHPKAMEHSKLTEFSNTTGRTKKPEQNNPETENLNENKRIIKEDPLPIPVLRHSSKPRTNSAHEISELSDAMRVVDDKWRVPAVQKNILKSLPNEEGKSVSILTQLGSIRRQLQLEQLKLDKMLSKDSDV